MKPVWLLDVDGVINGNRCGWGAAPNRTFMYSSGTAFRMRWSPALMARIRSLHRADVVEIRWCTSWCPERTQLENHFRLPEFPATLPVEQAESIDLDWYKEQVALKVVYQERRPLIWTDDMAFPAGENERRAFARPDCLLIQPNSSRCLREEHMDYIEEWARKWQPAQSTEEYA